LLYVSHVTVILLSPPWPLSVQFVHQILLLNSFSCSKDTCSMYVGSFLPVITVLERIICSLWKLIYLCHFLKPSYCVKWYCRLLCSNMQAFADLCVVLVTFILLLYSTCVFTVRNLSFFITVKYIVFETKSTTPAWKFTNPPPPPKKKKERKETTSSLRYTTFVLAWRSKQRASCRITNYLNPLPANVENMVSSE